MLAAMAPDEVSPRTLVRDVLMGVPGARIAFERHQVDFCCHGALPLEDACARVGADVGAVLRALREEAAKPDAPPPWDDGLLALPLEDVVRHLAGDIHARARTETLAMIEKASSLSEVKGSPITSELERLAAELEPHLRFEERYVFPYVVAMEVALSNGSEPPVALFASVREPIRDLVREHEHAERSLDALRELTGGYRPPEGASQGVRELYAMLSAHDEALVRHMHVEGNVLFPRAIELEAKLHPRGKRGR